jgi:lysyl-tRNA synthetase class 2
MSAPATSPGQSASSLEEIRATRLQKVATLQQLGLNPFAYRWPVTAHAAELQDRYTDLAPGEEVAVPVCLAGRIVARRVFGKLAFFSLQDETGTIQLYLDKAEIQTAMAAIDGDAFTHLKQLTDVGDILGVKGTVKRTEKGELSIKVGEYAILTKALLPLPDKWHGLTDVAKRYRQRYVDLIVNPTVRETFRRRALITSGIRRYLEDRGFLEIETPVLQTEAGGRRPAPLPPTTTPWRWISTCALPPSFTSNAWWWEALKRSLRLAEFFAMRGSRPATTQSLPALSFTRPTLTTMTLWT